MLFRLFRFLARPFIVSQSATDRSVVVGRDMIGATVTIGLDEETARERHEELLRAIAQEKGVAEAPLRAVLEKLDAAETPLAEIPKRLHEAADELLTLRAELSRLRNDRPEFAAIRARALAFLEKGEFDAARAELRQGREQARSLREEIARSEAGFLWDEARVDRLQLEYDAARSKLEEATRLDRNNCWVWIELGDLWRTRGSLADAAASYRDAAEAARKTGALHELAASHDRLGGILVAQRNLTEALEAYRDALAVIEHLATVAPYNPWHARHLALCYRKIGNVLVQHGDQTGALRVFRDALDIDLRLAKGAPKNAEWQRDLSLSYDAIGDVLTALGDLTGALTAFRDALAIRKRLVQSDPNNVEWRHDLSLSYERIGGVLIKQRDLTGALSACRDALAIREKLAQSDPNNAQWRRDLSLSYVWIGDVLVAQGNLTDALDVYRGALAIRECLVQSDPDNAEWRRDLIVSCVKLSQIDPVSARALLVRARDIARELHADARLAPRDLPMLDELDRLLAASPP
jgi:tetratricopeptide (TPR) repeat protein